MKYLLLALALAPTAALAQEAAPPANAPTRPANTPSTDAIGPSELQNFSLNGTITRPADQPPAAQPRAQERRAPAEATTSPPGQPATTPAATASRPAPASGTPAPRQTPVAAGEAPASLAPAQPQSAPQPLRQSSPSSSVTATLPTLGASGTGSASAAPADFAPAPVTSKHEFPLLLWLLAALALAAGGVFLFWRNRTREAYAGGAQFDHFVAPEPPPRPAPVPPRAAPAPPVAAPKPAPASPGLVSSRLRPWVQIAFNPTRCVLDDQSVTVEFELELFNSGSARARGVRVDAAIFNAGSDQDSQIGNFFANPAGRGESIEIPPLKRLNLKTKVAVPRTQMQPYELAGKQVFVPVIAFNALYGWSGGEGQTSTTYLLGRDTKAEKLAPFRIDLGPRIFRSIAARLLPTGLQN